MLTFASDSLERFRFLVPLRLTSTMGQQLRFHGSGGRNVGSHCDDHASHAGSLFDGQNFIHTNETDSYFSEHIIDHSIHNSYFFAFHLHIHLHVTNISPPNNDSGSRFTTSSSIHPLRYRTHHHLSPAFYPPWPCNRPLPRWPPPFHPRRSPDLDPSPATERLATLRGK